MKTGHPYRSSEHVMSARKAVAVTFVVLLATLTTDACIVAADIGSLPSTRETSASSSGGGAGSSAATGTSVGSAVESCSDGSQNQGEEGVDCGGPCMPCGVCSDEERRRCWVECVQEYPPECIHGGTPTLILGIETCEGGQWGLCEVQDSCETVGDPCTNGSELSVNFECVGGTEIEGAYTCFQPLGVDCQTSFYGTWPVLDCPDDLCLGVGDGCSVDGQTQGCEVHCGSPDGPTKPGMQTCINYCPGVLAWQPCLTNDACLN